MARKKDSWGYPRLIGKLWEYSPTAPVALTDTPKNVSRAEVIAAIEKGIEIAKPEHKKRGKATESKQLIMAEIVHHKGTKPQGEEKEK